MGVKYNIDVVVTDAGNVYMSKSEVSKKEAETGPSWNHIGVISPKEGRKRFSEKERESLRDLIKDTLSEKIKSVGYISFAVRDDELRVIYEDIIHYQTKKR